MNSATGRQSNCDYCGLPLGPAWWGPQEGEGSHFCCFGCKFAYAVAAESGEQGQARWTLTRLGIAIFFTLNVMVFTLALWSPDLFPAPESEMSATLFALFRWLAMLLALPVLFLLGVPLGETATETLRQGRLTSDVLLLAGVLAAFGYSIHSVLTDRGHVYFETGCVILVAVTLGRWLEATAKIKTSEALQSLKRLLPEKVRVVAGGMPSWRPLGEVGSGDRIRVLPGERIPLDGRILQHQAFVDEQLLTGESQPVLRRPGELVRGGTLNLDGDLILEVTVPEQEGTLQQLIDAIREAAASQGRYQRLADRWSARFLPAVMLIAVAAFALHAWASGLAAGILAGLAVLLIACPCALGLATPLAIWAGLGTALRRQVLFSNGDALARLGDVRAVAFDKTGTLTAGETRVDRVDCDALTDRSQMMRFAAAAAAASTHPLSRSVSEFAAEPSLPEVTELETLSGLGVAVLIPSENVRCYLGSLRLMQQQGFALDGSLEQARASFQAQQLPLTAVGWDGRVRGLFAFTEQLRPQARDVIAALAERDIHVTVLTGDDPSRAEQIAAALGVDVQGGLLPEDKVAALHKLRRQYGAVAMVGDGINDGPALAAADVGIALACGADVSRQTADVCLLGDDLMQIPWAIAHSRRTTRIVRQNLFWAFAYNGVGIGLAAAGWLNPVFAAAAMVASSLLVVSNSMRLAPARDPGELPGAADVALPRAAAAEAAAPPATVFSGGDA